MAHADAVAAPEAVIFSIPACQTIILPELAPALYWASTQHAARADCAWGRDFDIGSQTGNHESWAGRARTSHRVAI